MILSKLNPSQEHLLEFSIDIQGTIEKTSSIRFVMEATNYSLMFAGSTNNGKVTVKIPRLDTILESGVYQSKLEVLIGDKIFTPLSESIEVLPRVEVDIKESLKIIIPEIKVVVKREGDFNIIQESDYEFIIKDNKYYGIVSENKEIKTSRGFKTAEALIDYLIERK